MDYKKLANLLFPNVKGKNYYENKYKKREITNNAYVTRFAPSPTGYVHMGHMLQAFLDYTLAKQSGGTCIIRIEDTDDKRKVDDAVDYALKTLKHYNIKFDEGVISNEKTTGDYGPYYQSERKDIYQSFVKYLVEQGYAYPCFCTMEEEQKIRESQTKELGEHTLTGYYGKWRKCHNLTLEQVEQNLKANKPFTIRFKSLSTSLEDKIEGEDVTRGTISMQRWFKDEVILKSDGQAVYHLAHIVDDYLMGVNLVVRGSEWLPTYPLHIDLLNALKINKPKYLHTLLLCKVENGSKVKLSKRKHPECLMSYYEEQGYPMEAVRDYIYTLLNSNFEDWRKLNPTSDINEFKLTFNKLNSSEAMLDTVKIDNISKNIISLFTAEEVYNRLLNYTKKYDKDFYKFVSENKNYVVNFLDIDRGGIKPRKDIAKLNEVKQKYHYFLNQPNVDYSILNLDAKIIKNVLSEYVKVYSDKDNKDAWWNKIKTLAENLNFATDNKAYKLEPEKFNGNISTFSNILRLTLTGETQSVDMYGIMSVLGSDEVKNRFNLQIKKV